MKGEKEEKKEDFVLVFYTHKHMRKKKDIYGIIKKKRRRRYGMVKCSQGKEYLSHRKKKNI